MSTSRSCARVMPDVGQAPLLLHPLLLDRADVREDPLLHPDHEDGLELEPLGVVQGHQRDEALLAADRVLVGVERDLLQEAGQARLRRLLLVLARDADELLQVLDPPLRLDRPLGLERLQVAGAVEHRPRPSPARSAPAPPTAAREQRARRAFTAFSGAAPTPGLLAEVERLPERDPAAVGIAPGAATSVASPIPRRGRLAMRSSETASNGLSITCR